MAKTAPEIPSKLFYKIGEVCEITDTQPYVLRFWESEFPQLAPKKNRSGQRVYQRKDIDTVVRIKKLLYEEEYTIAGARRKLDEEHLAAPGTEEPSGDGRESVSGRPEEDHPVDMLSARAARSPREVQPELPTGDPEHEARLERALGELKKALREVQQILGKE